MNILVNTRTPDINNLTLIAKLEKVKKQDNQGLFKLVNIKPQ
jgi:hypothetical protein